MIHLDLRERPEQDELAQAVLGPSGNLRAPSIRRGKKMLVGFEEEMFVEHLAGRESG